MFQHGWVLLKSQEDFRNFNYYSEDFKLTEAQVEAQLKGIPFPCLVQRIPEGGGIVFLYPEDAIKLVVATVEARHGS